MLGFYSFCRRSEILAIQYEDLIFSDDGSIQVRINFSKTDQTGVGRVIDLPKKEDQYCPVKSIIKLKMQLITLMNYKIYFVFFYNFYLGNT